MEDLSAALDRLVEKYEILRTRFPHFENVGGVLQVIDPPAAGRLEVVEGPTRDVPLDLASGPTVRFLASSGAEGGIGLEVVAARACLDGASIAHLAAALARELEGGRPEEEDMQYADLAEWLVEALEDEESLGARRAWRQREPGLRPGIPGERRTVTFELDGVAEGADVTAALVATLEGLRRRAGSDRDEGDGVGVVLSGRAVEGLECALGPIERLLPLALPSQPNEPFAGWAAAAREGLAQAEGIQESWDPSDGRTTGISLAAYDLREAQFGPVRVDSVVTVGVESELDVQVNHLGSGLSVTLSVPEGRGGEANLWAERLRTLFEAGLARPDEAVADLPLCGDEEQVRLAELESGGDGPPAEGLLGLIEKQCRRDPDRPAVAGSAGGLTYGELDARANQLARALGEQGVQTGDVVGLYVRRGPDLPVGILGILRAGAAYAPIDPGYPPARQRGMAEDAGIRVVATDGSGDLPDGVTAVPIGGHDLPVTSPEVPVRDDDLAYVIFTSGSTGRPKGVEVTHGNLGFSTRARLAYYPSAPGRFLLVSSYSFDSSVVGLFWTLASGGTLVLPSDDEVADVVALTQVIEREKVSHTLCLPSLYRVLLSEGRPEAMASLETVIVAGEACPASLTDLHFATLPSVAFYNEYGPTEGTVWATVYRFEGPIAGAVSIGRPIPGSRVRVADDRGRPTPLGTVGEIRVGGPGVVRGYRGRDALTRERFVADPDGGERRWYRTGDRGRWGGDGALTFLGRMDHQVKVRGYRIELEEIECALSSCPGVRDGVVLALGQEEKRLVAWVVGDVEPETLKEQLAAELPEYMVPARFVALPSLPRMPNGKVDRKALPDPDVASAREYRAPQTDLEKVLASRFAEVLQLPRVGVEDGFFELGGNSIKAAILVNKLRGDLGGELRVASLFEHPSVAGLAHHLAAAETRPAEAGVTEAGAAESIPTVVSSQPSVDAMSDDQVRELLEQLSQDEG